MSSGWRIALWAVVVLLALGFLYLVRGVLLPFIVAFTIAALLDPLVRKLRLRGWSRKWAVPAVILPIYLVGIVAVALLVPRITSQVLNLNARVDEFANSVAQSGEMDNYFVRWNPLVQQQQALGIEGSVDKIFTQFQKPLDSLGLPSSRQEVVQQYIEPRRAQIASTVKSGFESFFGFLGGLAYNLVGLIVILLVPPMLLGEMEEMKRRVPRFIPPAIRASTLTLFGDIGHVFIDYLRGVATVVSLYMVSAAILLSLLNVPYAILLAILFGSIYMVPYFGNLIAYVILFAVLGLSDVNGTFIIHMNSPWAYAAVGTLIYAILGLAFDHLIYPSMVGNAVGLSAATSIFVIFCGDALFGLVGMIIAFPLAGAVKIILDRVIRLTSTTQDKLSLPSVPLRHRRTT